MNLNNIPQGSRIVIIALNPTENAIKNGALFSSDRSLWNLLRDAGILNNTIDQVELNKRVHEVCDLGKHQTAAAGRIGIADLLPTVVETNSSKVNVPKGSAKRLFTDHPPLNEAKKIVLLGQKVVEGFRSDYPHLTSWDRIPVINGVKDFGKIGEIKVGDHIIEVFAMPFPNGNNIPNKKDFYKKVL